LNIRILVIDPWRLPTLEYEAHYQVEDQQIPRHNSELSPTLIGFWPPQPERDETKDAMR